MRRMSTSALILMTWLATVSGATASEENFVYVDSLPAAPGELRHSSAAANPGDGIEVRKRVHVLEYGDTAIITTVVAVTCTGVPADHAVPYMVASKQRVKAPQSFAAAALLAASAGRS